MTRKPRARAAPRALPDAVPGMGREALPPVSDADIADGAMASFAVERDDLLSSTPPASLLPEDEEGLRDRDPFSADYMDLLDDRMRQRAAAAPRVDEALRADLLERPHLIARPEEAAQRGAAAVWRSLKTQLTQDGTGLPDTSDPDELRLLRRELEGQKLIVDSVSRGIDGVLSRIAQRLDEAETAPMPSRPEGR